MGGYLFSKKEFTRPYSYIHIFFKNTPTLVWKDCRYPLFMCSSQSLYLSITRTFDAFYRQPIEGEMFALVFMQVLVDFNLCRSGLRCQIHLMHFRTSQELEQYRRRCSNSRLSRLGCLPCVL